ncbi:uncharacterized protein [Mytilus edulis]
MFTLLKESFLWMVKNVTVLFLCLSAILLFSYSSLVYVNVNNAIAVQLCDDLCCPGVESDSVYNCTTGTFRFLVNTENCRIPNVDPFDKSIKHLLNLHSRHYSCDDHQVVTYIKGNTLFLNQTKQSKRLSFCRLEAIYRKGNSFKFGEESQAFNSSFEIKDEFIKVKCYNFSGAVMAENYHMHFIMKYTKNEKSNYSNHQVNDTKNNETQKFLFKIGIKSNVLSRQSRQFEIKDRLNILLLMIDSTSRINSLRYLPKTRQYLIETLGAVEMMGYNKLADNTMVNMVPFLTGDYYENQPCLKSKHGVDNCTFIWQNYSQSGYLTHLGEDWPGAGTFHYALKGFKRQPTDYDDRPFHVANEKGSKWMIDTCFHGKSSSETLHQRIYDLAYNLRNKRYFSLSTHSIMTHNYLEALRNIDNMTLNTFKKLYENNLLNNTFLAFFGDHGMRFGKVRMTFIGQLEERLPMMFIYVPQWFKTKYIGFFNNLKTNSRRLTTHFDMFSTLQHLLNLENERTHKYGKSLFREIPRERTCEDAGIRPHWCTCNYHLSATDNSTTRNNLASIFIQHLNTLLKNHTHKCSKLTLKSIISSIKLLSRKIEHIEHRVVIEAEPGDGIFEATLRCDRNCSTYNVIGDVSRVNKYGTSTNCVKDNTLRKICHCINTAKR